MMFAGVYLRIQANTSYLLQSGFSGGYIAILFLEIFVIFTNILTCALLQYLCHFKRHFHYNLTIIISFFSFLYVPSSLIRVWFVITALLGKDINLFIDFHATARILYISLMAGSLPAAIIERTFASVHLKDYEKKSRPHVVFISVLLGCFLVIGLCWDWFEDTRFIVALCAYIAVLMALSITWFLFLWKYNLDKLKTCRKDSAEYTLSTRFQAEENIRTFKLVRGVFLIVSVVFIIHCILAAILVLPISFVSENIIQIVIEFDLSALVFPVYVCFIWAVPDWRHFAMRLLRRNVVDATFADQVARGSEGDVYFKQLTNSWM